MRKLLFVLLLATALGGTAQAQNDFLVRRPVVIDAFSPEVKLLRLLPTRWGLATLGVSDQPFYSLFARNAYTATVDISRALTAKQATVSSFTGTSTFNTFLGDSLFSTGGEFARIYSQRVATPAIYPLVATLDIFGRTGISAGAHDNSIRSLLYLPARSGLSSVGLRAARFATGFFDAIDVTSFASAKASIARAEIATAKTTLDSAATANIASKLELDGAMDVGAGFHLLGDTSATIAHRPGDVYNELVWDLKNFNGVRNQKYTPAAAYNRLFQKTGVVNAKRGGVFIRDDDSGHKEKTVNHRAKLAKFGAVASWGLNSSLWQYFASMSQTSAHTNYIFGGMELTDHTPNHSTHAVSVHSQFHSFTSSTAGIDTVMVDEEEPGVDKIFLEISITDDSLMFSSATIAADIVAPDLLVSQGAGGFASLSTNDGIIVSYNGEYYGAGRGADQILNAFALDPDTLVLSDIYSNHPGLGAATGVTYSAYDMQFSSSITVAGLERLAELAADQFARLGVPQARVFIHPGGNNMANVRVDTAAIALPRHGYVGAATYVDKNGGSFNQLSRKTYGEPARFAYGFQSSDWDITGSNTAAAAIAVIAAEVAKNRFVGTLGHYTDNSDLYYTKLDSVLSWCAANGVRVVKMQEAVEELFYSQSDPFVDIMPALNMDKDNNGVPDGWILDSATLDENDGLVEQDSVSFSIASAAQLASISGLGGLEKGTNSFSIWTKGAAGDSVTVLFDGTGRNGSVNTTLEFAADTPSWTRYAGDVIFNRDDILIDVTVSCSDYVSGTVKVANMGLNKKRW